MLNLFYLEVIIHITYSIHAPFSPIYKNIWVNKSWCI